MSVLPMGLTHCKVGGSVFTCKVEGWAHTCPHNDIHLNDIHESMECDYLCPYMAANAEQQPEVNSSSHSGTELHCHTSSSPHTPPPPPPPPHPPPHPPPSTTTGQGENTTDVGGGAAGREHDTSTHVHTTEVSSCKVSSGTNSSYSVATMYI